MTYGIGHDGVEVGIATQKTGTESVGLAQHVVDDEYLTICAIAGSNTNGGYGDGSRHLCRQLCRHFLKHHGKASRLGKSLGVGHQFGCLSLFLGTHGISAKLVDALRSESEMAHHWNTGIKDASHCVQYLYSSLKFESVATAFLHDADGIAHAIHRIYLIAAEGHIAYDKGASHSPHHRARVIYHLVDGDGQCCAITMLIIHGDGRDIPLLVEEGIRSTQAFVALTGNAETNILACLTAKRMGVRKTVAAVENVDYVSMAESLDIGTIINKKMIAASYIYQMMLDADVMNVRFLMSANADVAEFIAKEGSKVTKKPVKELGMPIGVTIGGLVRGEEGMLVSGNTQIEPGDSVMVFCHNINMKKIEKYFI